MCVIKTNYSGNSNIINESIDIHESKSAHTKHIMHIKFILYFAHKLSLRIVNNSLIMRR